MTPGNQHHQYLSCYRSDFNQTLKVGFWDQQRQLEQEQQQQQQQQQQNKNNNNNINMNNSINKNFNGL